VKITATSINEALQPIELFYSGLRTDQTRRIYEYNLKKIVNEFFEDILTSEGFENRVNELVNRAKNDQKWIMNLIITMVSELKKRLSLPNDDPNRIKNPKTIRGYTNPLKKLLLMNEIPLVWEKIYSMIPDDYCNSETRGYTRTEIKKMIHHSKIEDTCAILIASSSGIRLGSFDYQWKDVRPVYQFEGRLLWEDEQVTEDVSKYGKVVCALILIYKNSNQSQFAFITPEAYESILEYREQWIQDVGREPKGTDPFFKISGLVVKQLSGIGLATRIKRVVIDSGLRKPLVKGQNRHEVPIMNGFRRFFNKTNKESLGRDSSLAQLIKKEQMMGHSGLIKLDFNYFKTNISELIEEYLNSVPNLTISDEERLKIQNKNLQQKNQELEKIKDEKLADMDRQLKEVRQILSSEFKKKT